MTQRLLPKQIRIKTDNGIEMYRTYHILAYNLCKTEDNIIRKVNSGCDETEVEKYEKKEREELDALKQYLRFHPDTVLVFDETVGKYIIWKD